MITANELRRCNWVMYDNRYFQIDSIAEAFPTLNTLEFGIGVVGYNNIHPIPLTEEILLKCGFVEKKKWFYKEMFLLGYLSTDSNLQAEWKFGGVEGTWNLININYVHQLQNLYYALTKTELIINL